MPPGKPAARYAAKAASRSARARIQAARSVGELVALNVLAALTKPTASTSANRPMPACRTRRSGSRTAFAASSSALAGAGADGTRFARVSAAFTDCRRTNALACAKPVLIAAAACG